MTMFNTWCKSPKTAADYCRKHFPDTVDGTLLLAKQICNNTFTFREHWEMERTTVPVTFGDKVDWEHIPAGDPEWTYALNRHTAFVILAKAYLYTGEELYAQNFARLAEDWISRVQLTPETRNTSWRTLEAGLRIENWLRAMQIFNGSVHFTKELKDKMEQSLLQHSQYLQEVSGDFQVLSNWGVLQDHGLFLVGIYFGDNELCRLAEARLSREIEMQVMRDGSHWEQSPMYHCEVLHCFLDTVLAAKQNGYVLNERFLQKAHDMSRALSLWIKPDGILAAQGDTDNIDARDLVAEAAVLFSDGSLKHYAASEIYEENIWDFGTEFCEEYAQIKPLPPRLASAALVDSGNYFMRSDNTINSVWLQYHCGCLGSGHGHADQLSVNVSAYGEDILIDSGRFTYVDSPIRRELKAPAAHNTTIVDGKDFSTTIDTWGYGEIAVPVKGEYNFTDKADYVSGAHLGYQGSENGVFTSRKVVYIKPEIFVVFDSFYTAGEHQYEQNFHFGVTGAVKPQAQGADFEGKKANAKIAVLKSDSIAFATKTCSREYNLAEDCTVMNVKLGGKGFTSMITVISTAQTGSEHDLKAELVPVLGRRRGKALQNSEAEAVRIVKNGKEYTVLLCHCEVISQVELLQVGDYISYGKAVIFTEDFPKDGLCLNW
ncbi:MAG: alginate lyase family protein [Oscillospiraceae bacterium]